MKGLLIVAAAAVFGLATPAHSAAAPGWTQTQTRMPGLDLVRDGCGPGGFRDRYGYCRPFAPPPPPPRYRRCPPGMHPTPYGCRYN